MIKRPNKNNQTKKGVHLQRQANISNYRPQALKELYQGLLLGSPTREGLLKKNTNVRGVYNTYKKKQLYKYFITCETN